MELSRSDAFLVLRTAYKTGLLQKMTAKEVKPEVHIPGTSCLDEPVKSWDSDFVLLEDYGQFLAELIDTVRKEGKTNG